MRLSIGVARRRRQFMHDKEGEAFLIAISFPVAEWL